MGRKGIQICGPKQKKVEKKKRSRKKDKKTSKSRLQLADWVILLTNVPEDLLSADDALVLMRCRWQIELLWKLWKQYGKIDTWRSSNPARIETEIFAKILGLLLEHWMAVVGCWQDPRRSLRKAQLVAQWSASALGFALIGDIPLSRVIERITGARDARAVGSIPGARSPIPINWFGILSSSVLRLMRIGGAQRPARSVLAGRG